MHSFKNKKHISLVRVLVFLIFLVWTLSLLFPLVWGFLMSMLSRGEFNAPSTVIKFPSRINFSNYALAWKELTANGYSLLTMVFNSLYFAVMPSFLTVILSAMRAYIFSKYKFFGKKFFWAFTWVTMMIPLYGNMSSNVRFNRMIGTYNSYTFVLLCLGSTYMFLFLYSTFQGVSWEYAESAIIDGAGHFRIFFQIMLPQIASPAAALFVTETVVRWNDSMTPLIYYPDLPTLASGLYIYQVVASRQINYPVLFASCIMGVVPVLTLFFIFQKNLMDIQLGGGLKG